MKLRRSSRKLNISPLIVTIALLETILWISFCSTVICASPSSAAVVSSAGTASSSNVNPVQVFLQTQNQLVFVTEPLSVSKFQEPDSVNTENQLANSKGDNAGAALVREHLLHSLLKDRGENHVPTLKRSNLINGSAGRSSGRDNRFVIEISSSEGSEGNGKDGKRANRRV